MLLQQRQEIASKVESQRNKIASCRDGKVEEMGEDDKTLGQSSDKGEITSQNFQRDPR